ncbi:MAG: ChbG/HpnK family deacetylase [Epsilonproteobacteria bacterium]|nr:ChbG/HpnK family deacetylase [Campylobacterota bacterium]
MQKIFIHADDFGNSLHISECICKCLDIGALNSTSIIVNSDKLDESLKLIKGRKIRKVLHLNIAEGKAISNQNFQYLTDKNCHFFRSWQRVVFEYYCISNKDKKELIKKEIKKEFKNQILLYCEKLQTKDINIDSHQHYHVIPFMTDILIELKDEININILNIRVTKERFFWAIGSFGDLKNYIGVNFLVHFLLNFLANKMIKKFNKLGIKYNDAFIGVLFSGDITFKAIQKGLEKVEDADTIEILLHPGYLSSQEKAQFKNDQFKRFYISKNRNKEMSVLLSEELKKLIDERIFL